MDASIPTVLYEPVIHFGEVLMRCLHSRKLLQTWISIFYYDIEIYIYNIEIL